MVRRGDSAPRAGIQLARKKQILIFQIGARKRGIILLVLILAISDGLLALEPPTKQQLAQYRLDGTFAQRLAFAKALGNDRVNPGLLQEFQVRLERLRLKALGMSDAEIDRILPVLRPPGRLGLRSKGNNKVFVLLIDFPDYPASQTAASIDGKIFGDGDGDYPNDGDYPWYESLRNFYRRSSYNQLEILGSTLGWYRPAYTRADVPQTSEGRENLIKEALTYFDGQGHDFSQYDNDNDGVIDYFLVIWTGPPGAWASFWWGMYLGWMSPFVLDGKQFNGPGTSGTTYSWQWESNPYPGTFYPGVTIHETGHALGLPDLYDYDDTVGPKGGVGGLDMMDGACDHNCFSKMLLDWLTPQVCSSGSQTYVLRPTGSYPEAVIFWPNYDIASPFTEFFMVQNRYRVENDFNLPADGLLIWHIDARLDAWGAFAYNNSYTTHKLVRLMEADGLEEIERNLWANAGDYYVPGKAFSTDTVPNSMAYDGSLTKVDLGTISTSASDISCRIAVVAAPPTIMVTSPNGGEIWTIGSSQAIVWTTTGTIGNVKLEYSTDEGVTYALVIASTPNTGTYAWTVPSTPSTTCIVKASDAANEALNDVSNAVFSIVAIPMIRLSRSALFFGSAGSTTSSQPVVVSNSGGGTLNWSASSPQSWISVTPSSGAGTVKLSVSVNPAGLATVTHTGVVNITAAGAINSPQSVAVTLKVYAADATSAPFGAFDTPISGSTVRGSIPVTGWALDDIEVTKVEVRRGPVTGDPPGAIGADGLIYVGDATFVEGARPDIEAAQPSYPLNYRAGWGYMLLTYGLPAHGNGTFVLHAVAFDKDGHTKELGTKTIVSDNANNTKPFGAIDTPGQGATVSGNSYVNFGWVLTPPPAMVPIDGSTIWLWIDSVQVGHPTYNQFRPDVHDAYPDYLNADGAVGFYYIDTTAYADGMHTIGWSATDDHSQAEGMGSRFFWVFNGSGMAGLGATAPLSFLAGSLMDVPTDLLSPVYLRRGFRDSGSHEVVSPDEHGLRSVATEELSRLVIALDSPEDLPSALGKRAVRTSGKSGRWAGYLVVENELRPLPIGSTLDAQSGIFYWQPGPGFLGTYSFIFVDGRTGMKKSVAVTVKPRSFLRRR